MDPIGNKDHYEDILSPIDLQLINEHIISSELESSNSPSSDEIIIRQKMIIRTLKNKWLEYKKLCKDLKSANIDLKQKYDILEEKQKKWTFYKEAANQTTIVDLREKLRNIEDELVKTKKSKEIDIEKAIEKTKKQLTSEHEKQLKKAQKISGKFENKSDKMGTHNNKSSLTTPMNKKLRDKLLYDGFLDAATLSPIKSCIFLEETGNLFPHKKSKANILNDEIYNIGNQQQNLVHVESILCSVDQDVPNLTSDTDIPPNTIVDVNEPSMSPLEDECIQECAFSIDHDDIIKEIQTNHPELNIITSDSSDDGEIYSDSEDIQDEHISSKQSDTRLLHNSKSAPCKTDVYLESLRQDLSIENFGLLIDFYMDRNSVESHIDYLNDFMKDIDNHIIAGRICMVVIANFLKSCPTTSTTKHMTNNRKYYFPKCTKCNVCYCHVSKDISVKKSTNRQCSCCKSLMSLLKSTKSVPPYAKVLRLVYIINRYWPNLSIYSHMVECIRIWIRDDNTISNIQSLNLFKILLELCKLTSKPKMVISHIVDVLSSNSHGDNIIFLSHLLVNAIKTYPASLICSCNNIFLCEFEWCIKLVLYWENESKNSTESDHLVYNKNYLKYVCKEIINLKISPLHKIQFEGFFSCGNSLINFFINNNLTNEFVTNIMISFMVGSTHFVENCIVNKIIQPILVEINQIVCASTTTEEVVSNSNTNQCYIKFQLILNFINMILTTSHQYCTKRLKFIEVLNKLAVQDTLNSLANHLNNHSISPLLNDTINQLVQTKNYYDRFFITKSGSK